MQGKVVSLHIARASQSPMISLEEAHLVAGKGIEGDRFYSTKERPMRREKPTYEVTLIEEEAIEALKQSQPGSQIEDSGRRNIVVRGCALSSLDAQIFRVGEVLLRGVVPHTTACTSPAETQQTVCNGVQHRWIGAEILSGGSIRVGDRVERVEGHKGKDGKGTE